MKILFTILILALSAFGQGTKATITGENVNLRAKADIKAKILAVLPSGTSIRVLSKDRKGDWYKVKVKKKLGWIRGDFFTFDDAEENASDSEISIEEYLRQLDAYNLENGWLRIGRTLDRSYYYKRDSVKNYSTWVKIYFDDPHAEAKAIGVKKDVEYSLIFYSGSCENETLSEYDIVYYSEDGSVISSSTGYKGTSRIIPESIGVSILKVLCQK